MLTFATRRWGKGWVLDGLVAGGIGLFLLLLGGVTPAARVVQSLWVIATAGYLLWQRRLSLGGVSVVFLLLALWTALGALPLPIGWWTALDAHAVQVKVHTWALLGDKPHFASLALEQDAAWQDAQRLTTYALWAAVVGEYRKVREGQLLARWIVAVGLLVGSLTVIHLLVGAERVFGLYTPKRSSLVAPLMNANNLGGVLTASALIALGLASARRAGPKARALYGVAVAFLGAGAVLSGSRAATALLALGALAALTREFYTRRSWRALRPGLAGLAGALGLAALIFVRVRGLLLDERTDKLDLLRAGLRASADFSWLGAGRGGFYAAAAPYLPAAGSQSFEYAENFVVEAAVSWGLPIAAMLVVALGSATGYCLRHAHRSSAALALWFGCSAWWLQNLLDLGTELFGVGLFGVTLLAATLAHERYLLAISPSPRWQRGLLWCCAVLSGLGLLHLSPPIRDARAAMAEALDNAPNGRSQETVRPWVAQHPADPYVLRLAALAAARDRAPNRLAWLNWTLQRAPEDGRTWLLLAQQLASHNKRSSAVAALKRAAEAEPGLAKQVARVAYALLGADAVRVPWSGAAAATVYRQLAPRLATRTDRLTALMAALGQQDRTGSLRLELTALALESEPEECQAAAQSSCEQIAETAAETPHDSVDAIRARAMLLSHRGQDAAALQLLSEKCPRRAEALPCWWQLFRLAVRLPRRDGDTRLPESTIELLSCTRAKECVRSHEQMGSLLQAADRPDLALQHFERAATISRSPERWVRVLRLGLSLRRSDKALKAMAELDRLEAKIPEDLKSAALHLSAVGSPP